MLHRDIILASEYSTHMHDNHSIENLVISKMFGRIQMAKIWSYSVVFMYVATIGYVVFNLRQTIKAFYQ